LSADKHVKIDGMGCSFVLIRHIKTPPSSLTMLGSFLFLTPIFQEGKTVVDVKIKAFISHHFLHCNNALQYLNVVIAI
jgi:hypothetical protein